jgi:hypothetical protein
VKQIWFERGGALVLAILVCYIWLAARYPIDGESAELATLSVTGGAAHPPGYPLYVLWLRALSWLPGTSPAHTAALATTLLAALGFACLHAACRAWGARPLAATLTVATFAAAPVVLRVEAEPEVFALNNLIAAVILWLAPPAGPLRGGWRTLALGATAGVGLAHHTTIVLLAPVGLVGAARGIRESEHRGRAAALGIAGFATGLSTYACLLVAPDAPMSWGTARTLDDLVGFFLRRDYGGPGAFAPYAGEVDIAANVAALARTLLRSWLWLPLAFAVVGLVRQTVGRDVRDRSGWLALAASFALAGPLLAAQFNVPPRSVGLLVCERFHLLPALLLAPAVAAGIDGVLAARRRARGSLVDSPLLATALAILMFTTLVVAALPRHRAIASPALEKGVANTLRALPPRAVVITQTDDVASGAVYVQTVLGVRSDVLVITGGMLRLPWYRERVARSGVAADPSPLVVAEHVLASDRPLFVDLAQAPILGTYPTYPHGWLFRVLPRGTRVPELDAIVELNREVTARLDLDYPRPGPDDGYPTAIHQRYAQPWKIIARALRDAHRIEDARAALDLAHQLAPEGAP